MVDSSSSMVSWRSSTQSSKARCWMRVRAGRWWRKPVQLEASALVWWTVVVDVDMVVMGVWGVVKAYGYCSE
ncbi:hypothetical protein Ancab_019581 [Ancistrocladus abbreviatus]